MAVLNIRNLPDEVHLALRLRAARSGRSTEAEARAILTEICLHEPAMIAPEVLQSFVNGLYGSNRPSSVVDELLAERRQQAALE